MQNLQNLSEYLATHHLRVVTAESCTAGLVAAKMGSVPGCGDWLECSYVTYSPEAKNRILGVGFDTIRQFNLTSEQVAREMAEGALRVTPVDVAISNTGVAGPEPGDGGIPAGTVCLAWSFREMDGMRTFSETAHFDGDRNQVREAAADYAISRILPLHRQLLASGDASN